jgi:hypothetical protein
MEPGLSSSFVAIMMYAFPILILLMLGYMFWLAAYRLRRDRLAVARVGRRPRRLSGGGRFRKARP